MNTEQSPLISYRSLIDFRTVNNQITGIVHTNTSIYFLTKKRELYGYPRSIFADPENDREKKFVDVIPTSVQKFGCVTTNAQFHLLLLSNNTIYISTETPQGLQKFHPAEFDNSPQQILNFVTVSNNALLVAIIPSYICIYKYDGRCFVTKDCIEYNKKTVDMIGSLTQFLLYDKSKYVIYDIDLQEVEKDNLPSHFKSFYADDTANGFVALTQENQLININEPMLDNTDMSFSEDVVACKIKLPYAYGISTKKLIMRTTVGSLEEQLLFKCKSPIIDILEDYNMVIGNGTTIHIAKFCMNQTHPFIPHVAKFRAMMKEVRPELIPTLWECQIKLCQRFISPTFDYQRTLNKIYFEYSDSLISSRDYKKAFEMFALSGEHPFVILHNFRQLLHSSSQEPEYDFLTLANEDCVKYITLVKDAQKAINAALSKREEGGPSFDDEVNEVVKCRTACILHTGQRINPPTFERAKSKLIDLSKWAEKTLEEANDTLHNITNTLFSLKGAKVTTREDGIYELQNYVSGIANREKQPTCLRIYNTILIECYAIKIPGKLEKFINENHPLFFDVASTALRFSAPEDFRRLCRIYGKHEAALGPLLETEPVSWDSIIAYVKESDAFIELGRMYFGKMYTQINEKRRGRCVELFFSKSLANPKTDKAIKAKQVADILEIIQTQTPQKDSEECNTFQIKFLRFTIYDCHVMIGSVHWSLIKLYLALISPLIKAEETRTPSSKYIQISKDKEPLKTYRTGLVDILNLSDSYKTLETLEAIKDVSDLLLEERCTVLKKAQPPKVIDAIDLMSAPNVPIDVAIEFCDSVYPNIDKRVYNRLHEGYIAEGGKLTKDDKRLTIIMLNIQVLLNRRAERMELKDIIKKVPPKFKLQGMSEFLKATTTKSINDLRLLKLKNALLEKTIEIKRRQLQTLKTGKVVVTDGLKCVICGKRIGDSVFVALSDASVAHIACRLSSEKE